MELRHHVVIWLAVAIPILWLSFRKHPHAWILQNFLGLCFAINILRCVHFPSFKKGVSVMESVASGFYDLPVLMRVPHLRPGNAAACRDIVVILGCGDIVVPGLAVAYCRSYDVMVKKGSRYFLLAIVCYVVTLVVTLLITSHLNTGQPALLYLVPGILLPVLILAWWRGDLKKFWQGDLVPPESDMAPRVDAHVSSNEQFQMMQSRGLLYVATPVVSWFVIPLPVSQKDYDAKGN